MNPTTPERPEMQLPPPVAEQMPPAGQPEGVPAASELAPVPAEGARQGGAAPPPAVPVATPGVPGPQPAAAQPANDNSQAQAALPAAQDGDLIEKEWVTKAKAIVDQTKEDPYKQSEALTMFKADYMKKRYNRTIKLNT
jgi:hypothetical protein